VEGRDQPKGNSQGEAQDRTQSRRILPLNLMRVNEAAKRDRKARFTALLHHVDVWALLRAFHRLKRRASAGVDGETVAHYEQNVSANLEDLCLRIQTGRYRPQPVRRVFIPKADGGQRPLGIPTLEDKLVQSAVAEVLSAIYEVDFLGFSYGFRPGRNPHQALTALHTALMTQCVNWVLDADFRKFFDSVNHEWLLRMVAHRIADQVEGRPLNAAFDGKGYCWIELGDGTAGFAGGNFYADPDPRLKMRRSGRMLHWGKVAFEKWWLRRWF